jgi:intein/homing endonuclease
VREVFGFEPMTERANRIGYSTIVGEVLIAFGAHVAPKVLSEKLVPEWIREGPSDYKKVFIKALFDDDGSVMYSENYNAKGVNFYQIRHKKLIGRSHMLLNQVVDMLKEFDIAIRQPRLRKYYMSNGEEHAISYINITNVAGIINFYNKIGLTDGNKLETLKKIIRREMNKNQMKAPGKVLVLGSGALKIGEAGETL